MNISLKNIINNKEKSFRNKKQNMNISLNLIKKYLYFKTFTGVIHYFVTNNLDYYNILYFNLPKKN